MSARAITAGVVLCLCSVACGDPAAAARPQGPPGSGAAPREVRLIDVAMVPRPRVVAVTGVLLAQEELALGLQVGGRLETLTVDVGDTVAPGQVIAGLDRRDFELERARAAAALLSARAKLGLQPDQATAAVDIERSPQVAEAAALLAEAELQQKRMREMVGQNLKPEAELEAADAAAAVAKSRVASAHDSVRTWIADAELRAAELAQAEKRLADCVLRAPWAGRVAMRQATAGQFLAAGLPVVTLVRIDPLRLSLPIAERSAAPIAVGQPVDFTVDVRGDAHHAGKVVRIAPGFDRGDRTLRVEAEVQNASGVLLPGAFCRARIVVDAEEATLSIPKEAIASFAGTVRAFTVENGKAKGHVLMLGREFDDAYEVLSGVAPGMRIVADGRTLSPDVAVRIAE